MTGVFLSLLALIIPAAAFAATGVDGVADPYPGAAAAYVVVADGRLLWAHQPTLPRQPASLAKLLTALVLLDEDWRPDAAVRVSARAAAVDGSRLGLRAGEVLSAGDALQALLVRSANDACVALAEHAAGSLAAFAARMNVRARLLDLQESHFVHPCGLDADGQHTSARDLLRIGDAAFEQADIARIVRLQNGAVYTRAGRRLAMHNGNALLGRVDGVIGLKSGYTEGAGKCAIEVVERGGHRVWLVILGAPNRWWVAAGIIDAAFQQAPASGAGG